MTSCVILGAGNVAWSLASALRDAGVDIRQIWSRNPEHAAALAAAVGSNPITDLNDVAAGADIYIVSVVDDAIASIASRMADRGGLWVHTSGSVAANALSPVTATYGVLYPLQTFTRGRTTPLRGVPVYVEASDDASLSSIESLASRLTDKVRRADSRQRRRVHAAAVFACNFTNRLWAIADRLLRRSGDDLSVLYPLIEETTRKAMEMPPEEAQTGPARRGDRRVIAAHIHALDGDDARIYALLSENILKTYFPDDECDKL